MRTSLLFLSTIFLLISPIAYAISIIWGRTRPHRLTRLALMFALLLGFLSALGADANFGTLLVTGIAAVQGVVIFGLSMWHGMGGKNVFDWLCFGLAISGLAAWQLSDSALIGLWFAVFAEAMAYVPALIKTWKHPHTEGHWFYTLSIIGVSLSLVVYPLSAASVFQIYLILISLVMLSFIYRRRIFAKVEPYFSRIK